MSEYSFLVDFTDKLPEQTIQKRPNYRIVRCCSNCKFFMKNVGTTAKKGLCKFDYSIQHETRKNKMSLTFIDKSGWTKTHATGLCDNHDFTSWGDAIQGIKNWLCNQDVEVQK